jgi:hypothetical protein
MKNRSRLFFRRVIVPGRVVVLEETCDFVLTIKVLKNPAPEWPPESPFVPFREPRQQQQAGTQYQNTDQYEFSHGAPLLGPGSRNPDRDILARSRQ